MRNWQGEELKARLRKLAELAERKEYQELVKDIAPKKEAVEPFSSYKDQIGFGMVLTVLFFTCSQILLYVTLRSICIR